MNFSVGEGVAFLLNLERETGIEPATNGLGSRYSTIELLPLVMLIIASLTKLLPAPVQPDEPVARKLR
jgi:hypothetical protein